MPSQKKFATEKFMEYNRTMNITLTLSDGKSVTVEAGCTAESLIEKGLLSVDNPDEIYAVRINNEICSLTQPVEVNADIDFVRKNTRDGTVIYRRTLSFMLSAAAQKLFPDLHLIIGHSLSHGYYYTFEDPATGSPAQISEKDFARLKNEMLDMVEKDLPIVKSVISYKDAIALFERQGLTETRNQLDFLARPVISVNTLEGFSNIYVAPLLKSTGQLKVFDILPYHEGFLLHFPTAAKPDELPVFEDIPQLFNIFRRYKEWGRLQNFSSVSDLNRLVYTRKTKDFINIAETFQNKNIADIADQVHARPETKVVLIAGPSSSGKTTTSKKLAIQLQVLGYMPHVISLDNYYVNHDRTPLDAEGKPDYECLEALDVEQLNRNLVDLFAGKAVDLPLYDFREGKQYYVDKPLKLGDKDILIMEGIHGLNDRLTPLIPPEKKFKIYLSALTQLNLDDHNRIPTSDNRLIRRIVRDSQFRAKSAAETISMWPSVQNGERLHIFPFQDKADAMLNTALDYELAVLRVYAAPLLRCVTPLEPEYAEASRLLQFLDNFYSIPSNYVPGQSIIREFIGGSEFKY